ncbi:phosphate signaling complex protein PhoU [bacterium]|nr:phosphate signaling complex protein PhoU [bacterium]MBU1984852.1 phosphate signaling complex protein PhoU [bacterium]
MPKFLQRDLDRLRKIALETGTLVEESISQAIRALSTCDRKLAEQIIANDEVIDRREVQVEEDCLKILALHQPVARDLRFVVTVLKMNNDLERMGDYAVNMAERVVFFAECGQVPVPKRLAVMGEKVISMVRRSLDAVVESDPDLGREVVMSDDEVDVLRDELFTEVLDEIRSDPRRLDQWIQMLSAARYLERVADLATNIAQDAIYLAEGEVVRHRHFTVIKRPPEE